MKIIFYRSILCPRCYLARKALFELTAEKSNLEIEEVDILSHPLRTWKDGIRLIPALKIEKKLLSGVFLSRQEISGFIDSCE